MTGKLPKDVIIKLCIVVFLLLGFFFIDTPLQVASVVVFPNGREILNVNRSVEIKWTPGLPGAKRIEFVPVSGERSLILGYRGADYTFGYPNPDTSGSFVFKLPLTMVPGSYRMKIYGPDEVTLLDESDAPFTVEIGDDAPLVQVTSPRGGEKFQRGSSINIGWTLRNFSGNVSIELYGRGFYPSVNKYIIIGTANDGGETWIIPADIPHGTDYTIKVSCAGLCFEDSSEAFTIIDPAIQSAIDSIKITAPKKGEQLEIGATYEIKNTYSLPSHYQPRIDGYFLYQNGVRLGRLTGNNDGLGNTAFRWLSVGGYEGTITARPGSGYSIGLSLFDSKTGTVDIISTDTFSLITQPIRYAPSPVPIPPPPPAPNVPITTKPEPIVVPPAPKPIEPVPTPTPVLSPTTAPAPTPVPKSVPQSLVTPVDGKPEIKKEATKGTVSRIKRVFVNVWSGFLGFFR